MIKTARFLRAAEASISRRLRLNPERDRIRGSFPQRSRRFRYGGGRAPPNGGGGWSRRSPSFFLSSFMARTVLFPPAPRGAPPGLPPPVLKTSHFFFGQT